MVYPALMNFPEIMICGFHVSQTYTVEPCLRATSVIQSPHYYGHFFWPPAKMALRFRVKKPSLIRSPVNTAKFFGLIGDPINRVPL